MEVKEPLTSEGALSSPPALAQFGAAFLACTLPKSAWTHAAHILTAAWLVARSSESEALAVMRVAIPRFNVATGGANTADSGYHETLTCFWVAKIAAFLRRRDPAESTLEKVRAAVAHFGERRDWFSDHYAFDVVRSRDARAHWIAPDLRPID